MGVPDGVPEGRCGFTLEPEDLPTEDPEEVESFDRDDFWAWEELSCCWRSVWNETGRCIWHADRVEKPVEELVAVRAGEAERLDGAILEGTYLKALSFAGCGLTGARLSSVNFHGDLSNAYLHRSDFSDADLSNSDLSGAHFSDSNLHGANLSDTNIAAGYLRRTDLSNTDVLRANLENADLYNANLSTARFLWTDFSGADLRLADLTDADLSITNFLDVNLGKANLSNASLFRANLSGTNFHEANLSGADLRRTKVDDVELRSANLTRTDFEGVALDGVDFRDADLIEAKLHNAHFQNVRINDDTKFGDEKQRYQSAYELDADRTAAAESGIENRKGNNEQNGYTQDDTSTGYLMNALALIPNTVVTVLVWLIIRPYHGFRLWYFWSKADGEPDEKSIKNLEKSIWSYRTYQRLLREQSLPDKVPRYYKREKHTRRKLALAKDNYLEWLKFSLARWTMLYGESPKHVVGTSGVIVAVWTVLYLVAGGIEETVDSPNSVTRNVDIPVGQLFETQPDLAVEVWANLYFSLVTFTTLGYGDVQPASGAVQLLAGIQSLLGAALIALLVAVLSRRVMR